ncbi:MAG: Ig-like domain-containing protein, partial [Betaproteobacteria bacterium]
DLDQDPSTDRFVLIAWADPNSAWPGVLDEILATLIFDVDLSQGSLDWTTLRITGETAAGYALETQIIQVYGDQERPEQIEGTLAAGVWGYTPDSDKFAALTHNETVQDTFTFEASDGSLHPVTVTLIGENDAPVFAGSLDLPLDATGQYLFDSTEFNSNDVDNSPDEVIYSVASIQGGELLVNGTVANQFSQTDVDLGRVVFVSFSSVSVPGEASPSLVFTVDDGDEDQSEPEALVVQFFDGSQNLTFVEDQALKTTINTVTVIVLSSLLENDVSASGGAISIASIDSQSEFGGSVTSDGLELTYTPPAGFTGTDRVFYTITNESGDVASAYLDINVTADPSASSKSQPMLEADFAGVLDSGESEKDQGSPRLSGSASNEDGSLHLNSMGIPILSEVVPMTYGQFSVPSEPAQHQVATSDDETSVRLAADSPNSFEGKDSVILGADRAGDLPRLTDAVMLSDSTESLGHPPVDAAGAFLSGESIDFGSLDEFVEGQIRANEIARSGGPIDTSDLDIGLAEMLSSADEDLFASDVPQSHQVTVLHSESLGYFEETISSITEENLFEASELSRLQNILSWDDQYTGLI